VDVIDGAEWSDTADVIGAALIVLLLTGMAVRSVLSTIGFRETVVALGGVVLLAVGLAVQYVLRR
jgi:hypothetical protein